MATLRCLVTQDQRSNTELEVEWTYRGSAAELERVAARRVTWHWQIAGIPGNGKPFPDGSKIAKIEWRPQKMAESPFAVNVPDTLQDVFLIEKDSKRFPDSKGWAYAVFDYQVASDTFTPDATGTVNCGFACHTVVKDKDYIFHSYRMR